MKQSWNQGWSWPGLDFSCYSSDLERTPKNTCVKALILLDPGWVIGAALKGDGDPFFFSLPPSYELRASFPTILDTVYYLAAGPKAECPLAVDQTL